MEVIKIVKEVDSEAKKLADDEVYWIFLSK